MNESRKEYRALVEDEVLVLEYLLGHRVWDGDEDHCPRCDEKGRYDLYEIGFNPKAGNSIYYSTVFNEWRCRLCDYRLNA